MSRYGIIFKVIVYCLIALLFVLTIAYSIASPLLSDMIKAIRDTGWQEHLDEITQGFINGDMGLSESVNEFGNSLSAIIVIFRDNSGALVKSIVVFVVFAIVALYILNLANIAYSDVINHYMNSKFRFGFTSNFIYNLKKSALYSLLHLLTKVPLVLIATAVTFFAAYGIMRSSAPILALPVAYTLGILLYSTINVLFMGWVPAIVVDGVSVPKALQSGFEVIGKHFGYSFMNSFMSIFLSGLFVFLCSTATFGAGLLIAIPTAVMFRKILELVLYYSAKQYKFYTNDTTVVEGKLNS